MAWPTLRIISFINGIFLLTLAISMTIPMLTLLLFGRAHELNAFLWSSLITFIAGMTMIVQGRPKDVQLRPRDMYLLTVSSWVLVGLFAALPFMFSQHLGLTDAVFESMSGITATGATVLTGLDKGVRRLSELNLVLAVLLTASLVAILTTFGIVLSLLFESIRFFQLVSPMVTSTRAVASPPREMPDFAAAPPVARVMMSLRSSARTRASCRQVWAVSKSTISPLRTPRDGAWPTPRILMAPSDRASPTTRQIFEVPISRPA